MTTPQSTPTQILPQEEWRPVVGWEAWYEVSNLGRVRRIAPSRGTRPGRLLSNRPSKSDDYCHVSLHAGPDTPVWRGRVHQLVAEAFFGPILAGHEVNHIDTNRHNNVLTNLEYLTHTGNVRHAVALGRCAFGEQSANTKLREVDVRAIRDARSIDVPLATLALRYGISKQSVCDIAKRRSWRHLA